MGVRIADYRGQILSLHNGYYLAVDGVVYPREVQKFEINGKPPRDAIQIDWRLISEFTTRAKGSYSYSYKLVSEIDLL